MLTAAQLAGAAWRVPRVVLRCGRRLKSLSRVGNGGTTSPGATALLLLAPACAGR